MLKIWGRTNAFSVQKILWLVRELAIPHELIPSGGSISDLSSPEFLRRNPTGRLPVIEEDGQFVWESNSILRYLAARHGRDTLWTDDPFERSRADRWLDWSLATLEPAFMKLFWGHYRTPEEQRNPAFVEAAIAECAQALGILDEVLQQQPYVAGLEFSIGDIGAGASLYRYFSLDVPQPELYHVRQWYPRLSERPAYREAIMIPFDELRGRLRA